MKEAPPPGDVLLGFEVGRGLRVEIPLGHMVVSGQSQRAGKTTAMEALLSRSGARALAFKTKRGESAFSMRGVREVRPFFTERTDWPFVEAVLESTMRQRMRFERAWIMRATRGAKTLAEVRENTKRLQAKATRSMDADIYMLLGEYLDRVVPEIARADFASSIDLHHPGVHVMDLTSLSHELQALVIQASIDRINARESGVIVVVPEAWEFVPESRGSPVKLAVQDLVRKGAAVGNFAWLDSQDLAGVAKDAVRQSRVWLLGVQREMNEVKRTLAHIPSGVKKPRADEIAALQRGEFWACWDRHVVKVYVCPAWMSEADAKAVACGESVVVPLRPLRDLTPAPPVEEAAELNTEDTEEDDVSKERLDLIDDKLDQLLRVTRATAENTVPGKPSPVTAGPGVTAGEATLFDVDSLYQEIKRRLLADKKTLMQVLSSEPAISVIVRENVVEVDGDTLRGRLAMLIADGFFDTHKRAYAAFIELQRVAFKTSKPNVYTECGNLASMGFLTREGDGYLAVPGMKKNVRRSK